MSTEAIEQIGEPGTSLARSDESAFSSQSAFSQAVPMAKALASSGLIPSDYRNNTANCLIAMELATRTRASVFAVMQNLHIIKGKPSWSSAFLVASVNTCGRFSPLRYEAAGEPCRAGWKCRALATEFSTGEVLYGTWITWEMANGEGWITRQDSKWQTMPEQMIRYRAAAFWARTFAPEISLGMHTVEEITDVGSSKPASAGARSLNDALKDAETVDAQIIQDDLALIRKEQGK